MCVAKSEGEELAIGGIQREFSLWFDFSMVGDSIPWLEIRSLQFWW